MITTSEFWWENITGPRNIITSVIAALDNKQMVLLKVPSDLPWRHTMRGVVESNFRDRVMSGNLLIDIIDAVDDLKIEQDLGYYLLNKYAIDEDVRAGFREGGKSTIQEYLIRNKVLRNRIIWIKGLSGKDAIRWIEFCKTYQIDSLEDGAFVLEVHGDLIAENEALAIVDYSDSVTFSDVQLFNTYLVDEERSYSDKWKQYISTMAAILCETDAEVAEKIIQIGDFRNVEPIMILDKAAKLDMFERRGADERSSHILALTRSGKTEEINKRIWKTQIQILFPVIELERVKLIDKWMINIQDSLSNNHVTQYGVHITNPYDVEIGTLDYLQSHYSSGGGYKLYIPDETDRKRISFLHECRNLLAHVNCCAVCQVNKLLE